VHPFRALFCMGDIGNISKVKIFRLNHIYIESTSSRTGIHGNTRSGSKFLATPPTHSDQLVVVLHVNARDHSWKKHSLDSFEQFRQGCRADQCIECCPLFGNKVHRAGSERLSNSWRSSIALAFKKCLEHHLTCLVGVTIFS